MTSSAGPPEKWNPDDIMPCRTVAIPSFGDRFTAHEKFEPADYHYAVDSILRFC
jgi:hypothetical protein